MINRRTIGRLAAAALAASVLSACSDAVGPQASPVLAHQAHQAQAAALSCTLAQSPFTTEVVVGGEFGGTFHHIFTVSGVGTTSFAGTGELQEAAVVTSTITGTIAGTSLSFTTTYTGLAAGLEFTAAGTIDPATGAASGTATIVATGGSDFEIGTEFPFSISSGTFACSLAQPGHGEPCKAAPAVAAAYLHALGIDPNSAHGANIIAHVAEAMGPGATFAGLDKCDAGYAAAVISFVNSLLE